MTILAANGIRIGERYTLLAKLGEGGEGEVWRARDHHQGREVALKVLRPEVAGRPGCWDALVREHEISTRLDHPLILKVGPPFRDHDVIALPMELAPGGDMRRLCGVSYLEIAPVLMEAAQALQHAHERGVVHRDLKPGNILFDDRGHVRVADFGAGRTRLSPFTASPQQLRGELPCPADDIYGLGAVAYELLSGHPPFYPRFDMRRVVEEPVPPLKPAHLAPGRLVTLVMAMLAKQPHARPASMRDVLDALDAALNDTLAFAYDESPDALAVTSDMLPPIRELQGETEPPPAPQPTSPPHATPRHAIPAAHESTHESTHESAHDAAGKAAREPSASGDPSAERPLRAIRGATDADVRALWGDIRVERVPNLMKLEPVRRSRWPRAFAAGIAVASIALLMLLHGPVSERSWAPPSLDQLRALAPPDVVRAVRGAVEAPLRAMEYRADRTARADESAPLPPDSASPVPDRAAPEAPPPQSAPDQPPAAAASTPGRTRTAAIGSADANGASAASAASAANGANGGEQRGRVTPGVQPLLADAREAESARDFSRAAQDYSQALALDPGNPSARAGLDRANMAFGAGEYSQAVGAGFAALGAGRLEEARADFERARGIDPHGREAGQGLRQVVAALRIRQAADARFRARADLENRLQALVDDPQQLGSAAVRAEAASLIREADGMSPSGADLRSLAARLAILLPAYDKPVHLALVSDNLTEVKIPQIGSFGTFARRDIDLKPGKYTVIGTRAGYREVRRDVTVAPGQDVQTISVRCEVPI